MSDYSELRERVIDKLRAEIPAEVTDKAVKLVCLTIEKRIVDAGLDSDYVKFLGNLIFAIITGREDLSYDRVRPSLLLGEILKQFRHTEEFKADYLKWFSETYCSTVQHEATKELKKLLNE
jgi:hypothetical protein